MRQLISKPFFIVAAAFIGIMLASATGCAYDKEEILYPSSNCDTTNVTYSLSVVPILSANCYGCHSGNTPIAGFRFDSYANLKPFADNGVLLGSINHDPGFSPMPKGGTKLSACNIAKIRKWIAAGSPNN